MDGILDTLGLGCADDRDDLTWVFAEEGVADVLA